MSTKQGIAIAGTVTLIVIGVFTITRIVDGEQLLAASGTVEATEADLGFQIPGRIDRLRVALGDSVTANDTLATLDAREIRARRQSAEAQLGAAQARLHELEAGFRSEEIAQARATARAAERRFENAIADLDRTRTLFDGGAVSREVLERYQTTRDVAEADHERATEALQLMERGPRPEQIAAARAAVTQAQANVAVANATLDNTIVIAPFSGMVSIVHREAGEIVAPGAPVVTLSNLTNRWVRVYVREDAIGRLAIGRNVSITADTYRDRVYGGVIVFIANEAEFTPSNVQTEEDRVTLVYEVRVRITEDPTMDLKPGIAADVALEAHP